MDNLWNLVLEAHHPERNHHRRYELMVGQDLFGDWTLTVRYGRIGARGQSQQYSSRNLSDLEEIVATKLRRRAAAPRRIGCKYAIVASTSPTHVSAIGSLAGDVFAVDAPNPSEGNGAALSD